MPKRKTTPTNPPSHILVVDDDLEIAESIHFALTAKGYLVSVANDGNTGVAIAETSQPDLMIIDMMMPGRSGFLVLERLAQTTDRLPPVIMITANEGLRHRQYAEMLGVTEYLMKPFPMDRLLESVSKLLQTHV